MIGRTTLQEVREALAAAKRKKGPKAAATPAVRELEALARRLKLEVPAEETPAEEPSKKGPAKSGAAANSGRRGRSRRSARARGPRHT
jgi:hypothetical protein